MVYLVQYMTDDYLRDIATHFSEIQLPYPAAESISMTPQAVARAHELIEHGDATRNVPACSECHGGNLAGVAPAVPFFGGRNDWPHTPSSVNKLVAVVVPLANQ